MAIPTERHRSRRQFLAALEKLALGSMGLSLASRVGAAIGDDASPLPVAAMHAVTDPFSVSSADGTRLHCRRGSQGAATILFVHGWSCNQDFFAHQMLAAARDHQVLALDLGGHGRSSPRAEHSMEAFADDVIALAGESSGPLILVVHSAGGRVACAAATRFGDRLRGIIGLDCLQNLATPMPDPALIERLGARYRSGFEAEISTLVGLFFTGIDRPNIQTWVTEQMSATDPEQAVAAFRAVSLFDAAAAVQGMEIPVRAFNNDGVPTNVEAIRQVVPDFDATILAGQGHFPHLVAPGKLNEMLLETAQRMLA